MTFFRTLLCALALANTLSAADTIYQAEKATLNTNPEAVLTVDGKKHKHFSGSGYVEGFDKAGAVLVFKVNAEKDGEHNMTIRYSAGSGETKAEVSVNDAPAVSVEILNTKSWSTWAHAVVSLSLKKGENTVAITRPGNRPFNIDYLAHGETLTKPYMQTTVELVSFGKDVFMNKGCFTCHSTEKGDKSTKTGPNLFALYQKTPQSKEVIEAGEQHKIKVQVDEKYIVESIRTPAALLAIQNKRKGTAYLPIMPVYNETQLNDLELASVIAYIHTLNAEKSAGPSELVKSLRDFKTETPSNLQIAYVGTRPILRRGLFAKNWTSGRTYLVGTPASTHYAFDPTVMSYSVIWSGGFLDRGGEVNGRGGNSLSMGPWGKRWELKTPLLQPLVYGKPFVDNYTTPASLNPEIIKQYNEDTTDYVETANKIPARLLKVQTPKNDTPTFIYRVGENIIATHLKVKAIDELELAFTARLKTEQSFLIPTELDVSPPSVGTLVDGTWTLPPGEHKAVTLTLRTKSKPQAGKLEAVTENWTGQEVVWTEATKKAQLPKGYSLQNGVLPNDLIGRPALFEPLGIHFVDGNTIYVATRTAGIWKIVDNKWIKFSEGFYDSLGMVVEKDGSIVVGDKTGLVRLIDKDGDNWAEERVVINEQFRFTGVYHEYLHGPVKIGSDYYFNLNLSFKNKLYTGGMKWMATCGGLRGWTCKVTKDGRLIPFASGMRSTAGIAAGPDDTLWVTENQGSFVGSSTMRIVNEGDFAHSPVSLMDEPGKHTTHPGIQYPEAVKRKVPATIIFPHSKTLNSPGSPSWDTSKGKFGPFAGQMLVGDQTLSCIWRVALDDVEGTLQGALLPFAKKLASGVMRIVQSHDGRSLWLGQTGRGWRSRGGNESALQKITYDGETVPNAIHHITATPSGFDIHFTQAQAATDTFKSIAVNSWFYADTPRYGSGEMGRKDHGVTDFTLSKDGKVLSLSLAEFSADTGGKPQHSPRVYHLGFKNTAFGKEVGEVFAEAYYTLKKIPK